MGNQTSEPTNEVELQSVKIIGREPSHHPMWHRNWHSWHIQSHSGYRSNGLLTKTHVPVGSKSKNFFRSFPVVLVHLGISLYFPGSAKDWPPFCFDRQIAAERGIGSEQSTFNDVALWLLRICGILIFLRGFAFSFACRVDSFGPQYSCPTKNAISKDTGSKKKQKNCSKHSAKLAEDTADFK